MEIEKLKKLLANLYLSKAATRTMLTNLKDSLTNDLENVLLDKLIELNKAIDILERQLKNHNNG